MEVVGLSLVINMAAGIAGPLSYAEVLEQGRAGEVRASALLERLVTALLARIAP
jgi:purine nucleoside phosphorylase